MIASTLQQKEERARQVLSALDGAVVAFSGGVDSTLLLKLAADVLGDRCLALTAVSASLPAREREEAEELARSLGVRHILAETGELGREGFAVNGSNRCYFCKSELFDHCFETAARLGLEGVVYGATADDVGDHRPGMKAAAERGARAPLLEADLNKEEIRTLSRTLGLSTWDKPAMACLSSRIPYGTRVTETRLGRVERAEESLRRAGLRELRVRFHGELARIELGSEEWDRLGDSELRRRLTEEMKRAGFRYITLDLEPFRSGRMNEALDPEDSR